MHCNKACHNFDLNKITSFNWAGNHGYDGNEDGSQNVKNWPDE